MTKSATNFINTLYMLKCNFEQDTELKTNILQPQSATTH